MNCFPGHVRGDSQGRVLCGHQALSRKLLSHVIGPDRCVMGKRGSRAPVLRRSSALTGSTRDPWRPLAHPEAQPITGASAGAEVPGELLGQGVWARGAVRTRRNTAQHSLGAQRTRPARTRKAGGKGTQSRGETMPVCSSMTRPCKGPWVSGAAQWDMRLTGWADAFLEALGAGLWSLGLVRGQRRVKKRKKSPQRRGFSSKRPLLKGA